MAEQMCDSIGDYCEGVESPSNDNYLCKNGFVLDSKGDPLKVEITLGPGTLIDRFGKEDTAYFAPFGSPYPARSLPPSSLNDPYNVYRVQRSLDVTAGPLAGGFGQTGLGTQYIAKYNTGTLLNSGLLEKLSTDEVKSLYGIK